MTVTLNNLLRKNNGNTIEVLENDIQTIAQKHNIGLKNQCARLKFMLRSK